MQLHEIELMKIMKGMGMFSDNQVIETFIVEELRKIVGYKVGFPSKLPEILEYEHIEVFLSFYPNIGNEVIIKIAKYGEIIREFTFDRDGKMIGRIDGLQKRQPDIKTPEAKKQVTLPKVTTSLQIEIDQTKSDIDYLEKFLPQSKMSLELAKEHLIYLLKGKYVQLSLSDSQIKKIKVNING